MSSRGKLAVAVLALALAFLAGWLYRRSQVPSVEEKAERAAERVKGSWRELTR